MSRFLCIHGHFYQPPRENPWLDTIEVQDSAFPHHDWNARITAECYAPNAASRILDREDYVVQMVNNYSRISFNFGPTLLSWLQFNAADVYAALLEADRLSQARFGGHGSALAQVYNHIIMPLANERDRRTQVKWGIQDFLHRFGRPPEGMWLAETAVSTGTLEALAAEGIRFTLLAPRQARRIRSLAGGPWLDVTGARIDPTQAYLAKLPSGRSIALFFYDAPVSQAVAFERLLNNGESFAHRLASGFSSARQHAQLMHIATDGESYGHHHARGDMALAYALHTLEARKLGTLTCYGEFLERHPPTLEVEIEENSSWSCAHGVGRWREHCGCNAGHGHYQQHWRGFLRQTFDWLRDVLAPRFEQTALALLVDPWAARDDYISVLLQPTPSVREAFLARHGRGPLSELKQTEVFKLMEMQRHLLLMYTSCGWFFDDPGGLETTQVIQYAGRAVELGREVLALRDLESRFVQRLSRVVSNQEEVGNGRDIYRRAVRERLVTTEKVAAHGALCSLFEDCPEVPPRFHLEIPALTRIVLGGSRFSIGKMTLSIPSTIEKQSHVFAALHLGGHHLMAGVRPFQTDAWYNSLEAELRHLAEMADVSGILRLFHREMGELRYSLSDLFLDRQRALLEQILLSSLSEDEVTYRKLFERHEGLIRFLANLGSPLPLELEASARLILNLDLRKALSAEHLETAEIGRLIGLSQSWKVPLDEARIRYLLDRRFRNMLEAYVADPLNVKVINSLKALVYLSRLFPFVFELGQVQTTFYRTLQARLQSPPPAWSDEEAERVFQGAVCDLAQALLVRMPALPF